MSKSRWRPGRASTPASTRRPLADGVIEQGGEVVLARDADAAADPALVFRVGAAAAEHELPVSRHALDRLAVEAPPPAEPWSGAVRNAFLAMLGAGRGTVPVIDAFDQAGLFARYLPEWEHVRFRPQRNAVHRFTVDRHLVETTVEAGLLARHVGRPDLLLLGALLHDIGKGQPGDHTDAGVAMTEVIAPRLGLTAEDSATVVALVRNHLLLPDTATRRDIDDPATVAAVAAAVDGSRQTLELLHALTEADAMATGPAAWSEWKASLIAELVRRTTVVLAGDPPPQEQVLDDAQRAQAERGELDVAAEASAPGSWTVTVTAPDRPGLLWRAAGVLALHRLDVHAATATSVGTVAVSVFTVSPVFGAVPDWRLVRDDLRAALDGNLPLTDRLAERERAYAGVRTHHPAPPRVLFVDDASASSTVVEVRAHDSAGLLHRIGRALEDCALDIRTARVSTLGAEAVDVFYVVDRTGAKLTDRGEREKVEATILGALGA
jgi:[protein-PII] uridylyltransferase